MDYEIYNKDSQEFMRYIIDEVPVTINNPIYTRVNILQPAQRSFTQAWINPLLSNQEWTPAVWHKNEWLTLFFIDSSQQIPNVIAIYDEKERKFSYRTAIESATYTVKKTKSKEAELIQAFIDGFVANFKSFMEKL